MEVARVVNEQRQTDGDDWNDTTGDEATGALPGEGGGGPSAAAATGAGDWQTAAADPNDLLQESARQPGEGRRSWGTGAGHETTGGGMTGGTGTGMTSGGGWSEGDGDANR
jgi:hypothetical protein